MTTIIGVREKNPETEEYYVLLASDSRFTHADGKTDNEKKIYSPKNSNYALASSGKNLIKYFHNDREAEKILIDGGEYELPDIEGLLWHIAGTLQENNLSNNYLLAYRGKHGPLLFSYSLKLGLQLVRTNAATGSGSIYIGKSLHDSIQDYKNVNRKIGITPDQLQEIVLDQLKEAAKKDKGTGGRAQFAIITSKSIDITTTKESLHYTPKSFRDDELPGNQHPWHRGDD